MNMHLCNRLKSIGLFIVIVLLTAFRAATASASAEDAVKSERLVEKATLTFQEFVDDPNMEQMMDLLKKARGVMIAPQLLKAAFIFGAEGGNALLLARQDLGGKWYGPGFYTIGGASFGLQIGGQAAEVVLLAMTERGVMAFQSNSFKLGANAGIAVGPVGAGASAATANLSADILSFSRAKGLYGGIALDGSVVSTRHSWNNAYYHQQIEPADIFIRGKATNTQATQLINTVAKAAGGN